MVDSAKARLPQLTDAQLLIVFAIVAWLIYSPALAGEFVSDDVHYVQANGYVHELSAENLMAILDPTGPLPRIVENYAPVHLLLHAVAWQAFGPEVRGHHAVNVLLHALASWLLVLVLRRSGIANIPAALGGAFFLVHPANVEAVAWINQLKSSSAMVLGLGALLLHPRRPAAALGLFVLALLAKPTAAAMLFAALAFGLARTRPVDLAPAPPAEEAARTADWRWRWIALWAVALAAFAVVELAAFDQTAGQHKVFHPDLSVRLRTMIAVVLRYLVMATTSYGLSVFQEPEPAVSLLDPWWLVSLAVLGALAWRLGKVVAQRREEAAYWIWALAAFAPVSGVIPLPHIIADRYLYFVLPGLIGAVLLAGPELLGRLPRIDPARAGRVFVVAGAVWIAVFAARSYSRAYVWRGQDTITEDVLAHYPEGRWARVELAARAVEAGDGDLAVAYLREARDRGFDKLDYLLRPRFEPLRQHPDFITLQREIAHAWVARVSSIADPAQSDLMVLAQAHVILGELDAARECLHRAIYAGGPMTDYLYGALEQLEQLERSRSTSPSR